MRLLLDTHTLLWFALGDPQLTRTARGLIDDPLNDKCLSPASYWEIAIKISVGKYALGAPYDVFMRNAIQGNGFQVLPIEVRHTSALISLPFHHKDPFDRLLIAQSLVEKIPIVSNDATLDAYGINRLW